MVAEPLHSCDDKRPSFPRKNCLTMFIFLDCVVYQTQKHRHHVAHRCYSASKEQLAMLHLGQKPLKRAPYQHWGKNSTLTKRCPHTHIPGKFPTLQISFRCPSHQTFGPYLGRMWAMTVRFSGFLKKTHTNGHKA